MLIISSRIPDSGLCGQTNQLEVMHPSGWVRSGSGNKQQRLTMNHEPKWSQP
jgi:hypothetical protein